MTGRKTSRTDKLTQPAAPSPVARGDASGCGFLAAHLPGVGGRAVWCVSGTESISHCIKDLARRRRQSGQGTPAAFYQIASCQGRWRERESGEGDEGERRGRRWREGMEIQGEGEEGEGR